MNIRNCSLLIYFSGDSKTGKEIIISPGKEKGYGCTEIMLWLHETAGIRADSLSEVRI